MHKINVIQPFALRMDGSRREFSVGEHTLSRAELDHWFTQACIAAGRARLVADSTAGAQEEELRGLTNAELKEMLRIKGVAVSGSPNKNALIAMLLAQEAGENEAEQ